MSLLEGIYTLMTNQIYPGSTDILGYFRCYFIKALVAVAVLCYTADVGFPHLHSAGSCSLQSSRKATILPVLLMFITVLRSLAVLYCSEFNLNFQKFQFSWRKLEDFKASFKKYIFPQPHLALFRIHATAKMIHFNLIFLYNPFPYSIINCRH